MTASETDSKRPSPADEGLAASLGGAGEVPSGQRDRPTPATGGAAEAEAGRHKDKAQKQREGADWSSFGLTAVIIVAVALALVASPLGQSLTKSWR